LPAGGEKYPTVNRPTPVEQTKGGCPGTSAKLHNAMFTSLLLSIVAGVAALVLDPPSDAAPPADREAVLELEGALGALGERAGIDAGRLALVGLGRGRRHTSRRPNTHIGVGTREGRPGFTGRVIQRVGHAGENTWVMLVGNDTQPSHKP